MLASNGWDKHNYRYHWFLALIWWLFMRLGQRKRAWIKPSKKIWRGPSPLPSPLWLNVRFYVTTYHCLSFKMHSYIINIFEFKILGNDRKTGESLSTISHSHYKDTLPWKIDLNKNFWSEQRETYWRIKSNEFFLFFHSKDERGWDLGKSLSKKNFSFFLLFQDESKTSKGVRCMV